MEMVLLILLALLFAQVKHVLYRRVREGVERQFEQGEGLLQDKMNDKTSWRKVQADKRELADLNEAAKRLQKYA